MDGSLTSYEMVAHTIQYNIHSRLYIEIYSFVFISININLPDSHYNCVLISVNR